MFQGKNIVLCVTGGIACYKAVSLASLLKKNGANVFVVMTKNATRFVTPLTFKTITKNKVTVKMFDEGDFVPHISLSELADIVIVAPATANIIAKASMGIADDMVSTLLVSSKALKVIVPAMNTNMFLNPIVSENIERLLKFGYKIIQPEKGYLACGYSGIGRFPSIEKILGFIIKNFNTTDSFFKGKSVLLTSGGSIEKIDPVRIVTNLSSGKMGFAFAKEFIKRGARVTVIAANVSDLELKNFTDLFPDENIIRVESANDLKEEIDKKIEENDILFMASAVADYSPVYSKNKIKKKDDKLILEMNKTVDILKNLKKDKNKIYIGFAAESENLIENAKEKLTKKGLDFIVANDIVGEKGAIGSDKAEVFVLNKFNEEIKKVEFADKKEIAKKTLDILENFALSFYTQTFR
ncbi:MAG TPA: bifunctional phosphopantothenoylcysteine decarboxylase/phosphopantothenate--cysteine ligase CoaBC [Spirochaetota bacterium]|nr:bifunctional phosphopantothenoylcysteine decarboxylase/phosphopantothenate--cysteine ligase CoaBC [Spirochaetota bacterium]